MRLSGPEYGFDCSSLDSSWENPFGAPGHSDAPKLTDPLRRFKVDGFDAPKLTDPGALRALAIRVEGAGCKV